MRPKSNIAFIRCHVRCYSFLTILLCMFVMIGAHAPHLSVIRAAVNDARISGSERAELESFIASDLTRVPLCIYLLGMALYGLASPSIGVRMLVLAAFATVAEMILMPSECQLQLNSFK